MSWLVLKCDLIIYQQDVKKLESLVLVTRPDHLGDHEHSLDSLAVFRICNQYNWLQCICGRLSRHLESFRIGQLELSRRCIMRKLRVGLSELSLAMCVGAVLSVETYARRFKGAARHCFVIIVWNFEHLALGLNSELITMLAKVLDTMGELTAVSSGAFSACLKVLAKGSFVPGVDGCSGWRSGNFLWAQHT